MNRKRIPAVMLAVVTSAVMSGTTTTFAQDADDTGPNMEQRGDQAKAALKDAWIDGRLETAFLFNEHLNSFDIGTDVDGGVVRLDGTVESEVERDLAGEIAKSIEGVTGVENRLRVDASSARTTGGSDANGEARGFRQAVLDATLTARVKSKLLTNPDTSGLAVDVDSNNGSVTLSGTVGSEEEKNLIASIARNTDGARSVENRLAVETEEAE